MVIASFNAIKILALFPEITLCIHGYPCVEDCEQGLLSGEVELAFCRTEGEHPGYIGLQDFGSTAHLIVNHMHELAGRGRVRLADLRGEKLIADYTPDGIGYCFQTELEKAGITPAIILPYMSDTVKRALVIEDNYVAFSYCPHGWLPYGVVPVIVSGIQRYVGSLFSKSSTRPLSTAAQLYADFIVPRFKKDIFGEQTLNLIAASLYD